MIVTTDNAHYSAIASAIRIKNGETATYRPSEMADAILAIDGGSGDLDALLQRTITEIHSSVTSIGGSALSGCPYLAVANLPLATSIGAYSFSYCSSLLFTEFPLVVSIDVYAFYYCNSLTTVDLPSATSMGEYVFGECHSLVELILRKSDAICTLADINALNNTPIAEGTGYVYVPASLIDSYTVDGIWASYATQFRAIEDYPAITGGWVA